MECNLEAGPEWQGCIFWIFGHPGKDGIACGLVQCALQGRFFASGLTPLRPGWDGVSSNIMEKDGKYVDLWHIKFS